jgi:olefin beta-lactone synthetase
MADPFAAFGPLPERVNVSRRLMAHAQEAPDRPAVIVPGPKNLEITTYAQLNARSSRLAGGLIELGVKPGDRTCVFVKPGADLVVVVWGLWKLGAVPVLIDPGMGRERMLSCLERMTPRVFIGIPKAHLALKLFPAAFKTIEISITVGSSLIGSLLSRGTTLAKVEKAGTDVIEPHDTAHDDPAAILFTSGSTGPPKGVHYTHGMFDAQVRALDALYGFEPGEIDLCGLPAFALFDAALGMTSVFPPIDPSNPESCDPAELYALFDRLRPSTAFASPAVWRRLIPWCVENGYKLEGLRRALTAGAPVPPHLVRDFHRVLPMDGDLFTPYGATEALPVSSVAGREMIPDLEARVLQGEGTPVGTVAPGIDMRLIRVTDSPIREWSDDLEVAKGEIGEVVVRGPVVTHAYAEDAAATDAAKIPSPLGIWHRMGDLGQIDEHGCLWFLGRKSQRLTTRLGLRTPVPTENVFNTHPRVRRTALVGVGPTGEEMPVLVVEPVPGELPKSKVMTDAFANQLKVIGRKCKVSSDVETFLFHPEFPVDVRHNSKIHREELKDWAQEQFR